LNQAAARGLLDQLAGKVSVVGETPRFPLPTGTNSPVTASVLESNYGYVRFSRVLSGADKAFRDTYERLAATNKLKGLVLDLRYSDGTDYSAAVALADRFFADEQALVDWGEGWKRSSAKTNAITLPVAVLVNRHTSGAAEALAGILRHREIGLLIGTNTAGQASMAKEFPLKTGQRLRLAVAPLKVADGKELPFTGIKADIEVDVNSEDELAWYQDAYRVVQKSVKVASTSGTETNAATTNRAGRRRINEAELVRMSKEGQNPDRDPPLTNAPGRTFEPQPQVVNDPALARALDLLKGLAVVQQFRSI
jgi:C-terminal processing protease CtpA/Prc